MVDFQILAENARKYCEKEQAREFRLKGACHENVIGASDYIRHTDCKAETHD
jgi:hypothetical protein